MKKITQKEGNVRQTRTERVMKAAIGLIERWID